MEKSLIGKATQCCQLNGGCHLHRQTGTLQAVLPCRSPLTGTSQAGSESALVAYNSEVPNCRQPSFTAETPGPESSPACTLKSLSSGIGIVTWSEAATGTPLFTLPGSGLYDNVQLVPCANSTCEALEVDGRSTTLANGQNT